MRRGDAEGSGVTPTRTIAGMRPWACSYQAKGRWYGIKLYAIDAEQLEHDWIGELPGFRVHGEILAEGDIDGA